MGLEIERKFLVDPEKWAHYNQPEGTVFKQGYLVNEKGKTVRIRMAGDSGFITIKGATNGFTRNEYEYEIPKADALELLEKFSLNVVSKTRYCVTFKGKVWEIDVFEGDNAGLIVAEIELDNEHETFEKPEFLLQEVTSDARYYNSKLSTHPFRFW